jgi:hypothetical protein
VNVTRWGRGRTNFKIGHFDVPFGLEPLVDTHFTLHQYATRHDTGFKKDWAMSVNGAWPDFEYEVSLTRGTGLDFTGDDVDPYLVAGRIGTPSDRNVHAELSALYGEIVSDGGFHFVDDSDPAGARAEAAGVLRRLRVGVDWAWLVDQFTWRSQVSGGRDRDQDAFNMVTELHWTTVDEKLRLYLQGLYIGQDAFTKWDEDVFIRLGMVWSIQERLTFSAQVSQDVARWIESIGGVHLKDTLFAFQFRLRF